MATLLALGACKATGGGYINEPLSGGVLPVDIDGAYSGEANFGFNFTCEMKSANKAMIKGDITYHDSGPSSINVPVDPLISGGPLVKKDFPEIRLHGTVDPFFVESVSSCADAVEALQGLPVAQFQGNYRSQDLTLPVKTCVSQQGTYPGGRFVVNVFDQGEPGRSVVFDGDEFSIDLCGGEYPLYTRGGYIEGGNIQVDNS